VANYLKRPKRAKIKDKFPITIFTEQDTTEGELIEVTDAGIFINCDKKLIHNETYRMVVRPTPETSVTVKGKFILSNLGPSYYRGASSNRNLSFAKISQEDCKLIKKLVLINPEAENEEISMEVVREIKMTLHLETDQRTVEKEFSNLLDLKIFMQNFFSLPEVADRRTGQSMLRYTGPERRIWM